MPITGGKVSYRRVTQPAPYESKEASVELSFSLEGKEQLADVIEAALAKAKAYVHTALGKKAP